MKKQTTLSSLDDPTCSPQVRIPFKWKLRWFLQGVGSILGPTTTLEQTMREIEQCADEMISKENDPSAGTGEAR